MAAVLCGHDGRRGYLDHMAIVPEYRGHGLGRQMVEFRLASLAALGILKCNIFLYADNESGQQFWNRCGWMARSDLKVLQRKTDVPQKRRTRTDDVPRIPWWTLSPTGPLLGIRLPSFR